MKIGFDKRVKKGSKGICAIAKKYRLSSILYGFSSPGWFIAVVTFVTLGLLLQPLALIINTLYFVRVCSPHIEHILMGVSALLTTLNGTGTSLYFLSTFHLDHIFF